MNLAVVVVAHESAGSLPVLLDELAGQLRAHDELVVVDNASADPSAAIAAAHPAVTGLVRCRENVGFAAGANRGAAATRAPTILFLNPDAVPQDGCLDALRAGPADWSAWMGVVALDDGRRVNTAGGELHLLGFGWAGRYGEPVELLPREPYECQFLSGACLAVRRAAWEALGGFSEPYFMYHEDVDLSLRLRLLGARFGVLPAARVRHDYSFAKGPEKWRLLERNRWFTLLRDYPTRLLVVLAPALLALEPVMLAIAARGGWLRPKMRAQRDVLRALPRLLAERRAIQAARTVDARAFAEGLGDGLDSSFFGHVGETSGVRAGLAALGRLARSAL